MDLDALALALAPAGTPDHGYDDWHLRLAMDARSAVLANVGRKAPAGATVWIIDSNADSAKRRQWHRMGAEVVKLEASMQECLTRAGKAGRLAYTEPLIRSWFVKHRPQEVPSVPVSVRPEGVDPEGLRLRTSQPW